MRARYPDVEGFIERDGVKVGYEVFGAGEPAVVFPPFDALVDSRAWKAQVPYLAQSSKIVTIDPRGNGRSDRPRSAAAYADTEFVADTIAVMDAVGIDRAVLVGLCNSSWRALLAAALRPDRCTASSSNREETEAVLARVSCPVLVIHGREDHCEPWPLGERVAELTGGELLTLEGVGHLPQAREPVVVNRAIRDFADRFRPAQGARRTWTRPLNRPRRVLYASSPIGLGHARRDLAIADELRKLRPSLEVHWLAQHPVTELLRRRSELIHPASAFLASESAHFESEAAEHDLHAFQAVRNMDEILVSNFMVFGSNNPERTRETQLNLCRAGRSRGRIAPHEPFHTFGQLCRARDECSGSSSACPSYA